MNDHAERTHRRYSASKMERLALCPGSDKATFGVAETDSVWSIEGTKAHTVLDAALQNRVRDARTAHIDYSALCMELLDDNHGGPYNRFYSSVQTCLDLVYSILDSHPNAIIWNEVFVDPPSDVAPGEAGGYCDIAIYDPDTKTLWVIDYKHGAGIAKAVVGNRQVMQYAAGMLYDPTSPLNDMGAGTHANDVERVVLFIIQPRAFHPDGEERSYELLPYQVYEYLAEMDRVITECQKPDAPLIPGDDQCRFCPIAAQCPAREAKALAAVNQTFRSVEDYQQSLVPDPLSMEGEHVERAMLAIPFLRTWANAVEKRLFQLMMEGYQAKEHKIVEAQARRRWHGDPAEIAKEFVKLAGCQYEEIMKPRLVSITDADEIIVNAYKARAPRGAKKAAAEDARRAMAFLTLKDSSGSLTLVTNDDDRPAINRANTAFAQLGQALQPGDTNGSAD